METLPHVGARVPHWNLGAEAKSSTSEAQLPGIGLLAVGIILLIAAVAADGGVAECPTVS